MKSLYWDVETSSIDLRVRTYQLKNFVKYFDPKLIERDWTMLGAAWAFDDGPPKVISVSPQNPLDDRHVVEVLHGVLNEADILIGHNSDQFDLKKFNTRAIYYGLPPIAPKTQIDTLKIARKYFKFTSNKLSYISEYLGVGEKDEAPDWDLCLEGDARELRYMRKYNKQDVIVTRKVYKKLMSWHHTHPRTAEMPRDAMGIPVSVCVKCGSPDLMRQGYRYLLGGRKRQRLQCQSCFGWQAGDLMK